MTAPKTGIVKSYDEQKQYGFILESIYDQKGVFVHIKDIAHPPRGPLKVSDEVTFVDDALSTKRKDGARTATNVRVWKRNGEDFPQ